MYRKFLTALLMIFSFVIIAVGGYQCSTKVNREQGTRESIPINEASGDDYYDDGYYYDEAYGDDPDYEEDRSSERPKESCSQDARSTYRDLAEQHGAMARFAFDSSSVEDYRLGKRQNFSLKCARMFLDMNKTSSVYKGILTIAYEDGNSIKRQVFSSGSTANENKYNRWGGGASITSKNFHAIFEEDHTAIILKLDEIKEVDIRDGETAYLGAGEIYYKMFRIWTGDKNDVCYTKGTYVSFAPRPPPRRGRCWLLGTGPFSCRPNGALAPKAQVTNISITGNLRCYSRLGRFSGLEIKGAFNRLP